jgi:hypothetical protein
MKQVVCTDLTLIPLTEENKLPSTLSSALRRDVTQKGAMKILHDTHQEVRAKIINLDLLEHADDDYAEFVQGEEGEEEEEDNQEQNELDQQG